MIKEKLAKLIDVKSIMTLSMTFTFLYIVICAVNGAEINPTILGLFGTNFGIVIGFYFAKKKEPEVTTAVSENYEESKTNAIGFQQEDGKEV